MKILNRLSLQNLKLNKKRTAGTIMGIILSVALITAVAGMFASLHASLVQSTIEETGYYHYALPGLDEETLNQVTANRQVEEIIKSYFLGTAILANPNLQNTYLNISSLDDFEKLPYEITKGSKPSKSTEIAIPESLSKEGNFRIGDTLELEVGTRMTKDGYTLDTSNPANPNETGEYIANATHKTYTITGFYKKAGSRVYYYNNGNPSTFYAAVTVGETSSTVDAFVALKDPKNKRLFLESLYKTGKFKNPTDQGTGKYGINSNYELLRWEVFAFSDETIQMLYTVVGVIIGIIVFTSIFCIRNSFAISTTEKSKMLGMLASVGATKKQIKKSVLIEAFLQGLIGIPLGLISGILADFILIKVVNLILNNALFENSGGLIFRVSLPACLVACLLGIITIYFSALSSARRASRISPIDNIKNAKDITLNAKNLSTPKIIETLFKTGGTLAYKNLRRSKKKYRTTVISLAVSIFIFISMSTFLNETFFLTGQYYQKTDYNIAMMDVNEFDQSDIELIDNLDDVEHVYTLYNIQTGSKDYIEISDLERITKKIDKNRLICTKYDEKIEECIGDYVMWLEFVALDDASFKSYTKKIGVDYDQAKTKGILIDDTELEDKNGKTYRSRVYTYDKGDTIKGQNLGKEFEIELAAITKERPYGLEGSNYYGGYLVVDKDYFEDIPFTPYRILVESNDPDKTEIELIDIFDGNNVNNIDKYTRHSRAINLVIGIFLYGFITVISLIGVTTIFNTITSNMELRSKEFAMMKSIGMTKKEFYRMINLETFFYSMKSLFWGITFGLGGSLAIHKAIGIKSSLPFIFPTTAIIISFAFVFILVFIIMHFSISKISKQNTIETIRKENI